MNYLEKYYWHSPQNIKDDINKTYQGKMVLDVGAGNKPIGCVSHVIDFTERDYGDDVGFYKKDVCSNAFPFFDNFIDFVFASQVVEDLHNPVHALKEIQRVGRAGYIETPSVLQEFIRLHSKEEQMSIRGHAHHWFFVWYEENTLHLLPKHSVIEYINIEKENEKEAYKLLNGDYTYWHNCFYWEDSFEIKLYRNNVDYDINDVPSYMKLIERGINRSVLNSETFYNKHINKKAA